MTFENGISDRCFRFETKVRPTLETRHPSCWGCAMSAVTDFGLDDPSYILGKKKDFLSPPCTFHL